MKMVEVWENSEYCSAKILYSYKSLGNGKTQYLFAI